jgi:hypothetical protein
MSGAVPAVIGLAGVIVGAAMTAVATWWQTKSSQRARISELEMQLKHERILRKEDRAHEAAMEVFYQNQKIDDFVNEIEVPHEHLDNGTAPGASCTVDADSKRMSEMLSEFNDVYAKQSAMLSERSRACMEFVLQHIEHTLKGDYDYVVSGKNEKFLLVEYCPYGAAIAVIVSACNDLRRALHKDIDA